MDAGETGWMIVRQCLSCLKWLTLSAVVLVVLYLALMVAFKDPILIERDVRVAANGREPADAAYEALGIWKFVFPNAPMPECATRDWGNGDTRYFWYSNEDLMANFEGVQAEAIVAVSSGGEAKLFMAFGESRAMDSVIDMARGAFQDVGP